jgi:hypothetical protein
MRLRIAILILLVFSTSAVETTSLRIAVRGFEDNHVANRLLGVARRCELRIDSLLGPLDEPLWLRIYPVAELPLTGQGLQLGIEESQHDWQSAPAIARALLHRRMDREFEPYPTPEQVPEWLVAAVAHQVVTERGDYSPLRRFSACRAVLASGRVPDLKIMLDSPVSPSSALFYQLYGEFCSALALSIRRADRDAVGRVLKASAADLPPMEILDREMQFIAHGDLQAWWRERLPATVFSIFNPITHEQALAELQEAQTIAVTLSDSEDGLSTALVPMDLLLERYRRPRIHAPSLEAAHIKLFNLLQNAPVALREPINAYLGALNSLREDNRFTFSLRLRAAKKSLAKHRASGPALQRMLRDLDGRKTYHDLFAYYQFFGHNPPTSYRQELRDYLEKLEAPR